MDANEQLMRIYLRAVFDTLHNNALEYYLKDKSAGGRAKRVSEVVAAVKKLGTHTADIKSFGIATPVNEITGVCLGCPDSRCVGGICLGVEVGLTNQDVSRAGVKHKVGAGHKK
jgi:hypothetical protein